MIRKRLNSTSYETVIFQTIARSITILSFILLFPNQACSCIAFTTNKKIVTSSLSFSQNQLDNKSTSRTTRNIIVPKLSSSSSPSSSSSSSHIIFPGGGLYFYWQAGAITYLRDQNYNLHETISYTGGSAGALSATLTATNVNFEKATELALQLSQEAGVWDRPMGLQGIWGSIIEEWLDELLPQDLVACTENDRLSLLVTPVPSFGKDKISKFSSRSDLIHCNMASVHIPLFLDGKWTKNFRNKTYIDGSFLAKPSDYHPSSFLIEIHQPSPPQSQESSLQIPTQPTLPSTNTNIITLDWQQDPSLMNRKLGDAVKLISPDGIWNLVEKGYAFARVMEKRGDFDSLLR